MTINIFILKGDLNGENRSGAFLFLSSIVIASPEHLNYMHENVMITSKVIFKDFPTAIFPSYGTTVSFSIPQTYHPLI